MSRENEARRAVAEIRWDDGDCTIASVGNRSIHQYWTLLSAYFRDVLLPPQRRAEDNGVTWTWREPADVRPVTASELGALRKRLADENQLFAENLARGGLDSHGDGHALRGQVNVEQLGAVMADMVAGLLARSDAELTGFVCRTETGLRVHSWGAAVPARPSYPETRGLEIAGRVLVGGKPARHDVLLESDDGELINETPSDAAGEFRFSKLSPGEYRLRARTMRGTFPLNGLLVELKRQSITDVVLADSNKAPSALETARRRPPGRSRRIALVIAMVAFGGAGVAWIWKVTNEPGEAVAPTARAEKAVDGKNKAVSASVPPERPATAAPADRKVTENDDSAVGREKRKLVAASASKANGQRAETGPRENLRLPIDEPTTERGGQPALPSGLPTALKGQPVASAAPAAIGTAGGESQTPVSGSSLTPGSTGAGAAGSTSATLPTAVTATPTPAGGGGPSSTAKTSTPAPSNSAATPSPDTQPATPGPVNSPTTAAAAKEPAAVVPHPVSSTDPGRAAVVPAVSDTPAPSPIVSTETAETKAPGASRDEGTGRVAVPAGETPPEGKKDAATDRTPGDVASRAPTAVEAGGRAVREVRPPPAPLSRTVRVRLTPWRSRVLADMILPTQPVPVKIDAAVEALRSRMLEEHQAKLPAAFRTPVARTGVVLSLPASETTEALAWVDHIGVPAMSGRIVEGRAEILWANLEMADGGTFRLQRPDRSMVAEVRIEPLGRDLTLRTTEDVRAWLRLAIETGPAVAAGELRPPASSPRFSWRTASGALLPTTLPVTSGTEDREQNVNVALGSANGAVLFQTVALLDRETGWAIVSDLRQAADRPLGQ